MSDEQDAIRTALRRRRRTLGLTQADVARRIGMPRLTYARIEMEGSRRIIRPTELTTICSAFNCSIEDLLADRGLAASYAHVAKTLGGRQ